MADIDPWAAAAQEQIANENVQRRDKSNPFANISMKPSGGFGSLYGGSTAPPPMPSKPNQSPDFANIRRISQSPPLQDAEDRSTPSSSGRQSAHGDLSALKKATQVILEDVNKANQQGTGLIQDDESKPYHSKLSWHRLRIDDRIYQALVDAGFRRPSRIQERALPASLCEPPQNLIAQSQSGTGKTAAFVIAMLSRIDDQQNYPQALVLAPTYELAKQIGEVTEKLAKYTSAKVCYAIKDANARPSTNSIRQQIIIGTPGTVNDWIRRYNAFDAKKVRVFVLDEADVMISCQGHQDMSVRILNACAESRPGDDILQCLFFSATYTEDVKQFAERITKFNKNTKQISIPQQEVILDSIQQYNVYCNGRDEKFQCICQLYDGLSIGQAMIFVHTKKAARYVYEQMTAIGHKVLMLTGEMTTEERSQAIDQFKGASYRVLISTNVTARGIDIDGVSMVVNYDLPYIVDTANGNKIVALDEDTYIHRIGRTGRFGKRGIAVNFIGGAQDREFIAQLEKKFAITIEELDTSDFGKLEEIEQVRDVKW